MKCMYAQTRPRFILSSEGVFGGMEFEPVLTPREKSPLRKMSPEEDRTRDAVDSEPKHYQLSYSGPLSPSDNEASSAEQGMFHLAILPVYFDHAKSACTVNYTNIDYSVRSCKSQ